MNNWPNLINSNKIQYINSDKKNKQMNIASVGEIESINKKRQDNVNRKPGKIKFPIGIKRKSVEMSEIDVIKSEPEKKKLFVVNKEIIIPEKKPIRFVVTKGKL